jgi:methylenetetrahydrofolate dehydrogenase (NADP+)/methenyltetrahydrofolate cyclohydrolase
MLVLEGKSVSKALRAKVKEEIAALGSAVKRVPGLAVILVGEDPASQVYVRNKEKACEEVGIKSFSYRLPADIAQEKLIELLKELNENEDIDGILLQLPLPKGLNTQACLQAIDPRKDVDGLHPENQGRLALGLKALRPCTPAGTLFLLDYYQYNLEGKNCVVLGRSPLVGRPLAMMLNDKNINATVTMCHSKTKNLAEICRQADFIFLAIGVPRFLKPDMVKKDAVIVDIGINRTDDGLCGDADYKALEGNVAAMTPVPGGIGLMTISQLLENTLEAWKFHMGLIKAEN